MTGSERQDDLAFSAYVDNLPPLVWGHSAGPARLEKLSKAEYIAKMHSIAKQLSNCNRCWKTSCRTCQKYKHQFPARLSNTKTKWKTIERLAPAAITPPASSKFRKNKAPSSQNDPTEDEKVKNIFQSSNARLLGGTPVMFSRHTQTDFHIQPTSSPSNRATLLSLESAFPSQEYQPPPDANWQNLPWSTPSMSTQSIWSNNLNAANNLDTPVSDQFQNPSFWPVNLDDVGDRVFFPTDELNELRRTDLD